jgi:uncharacterized protein YbcV (DUF1398 family)
MSKAIENLEAAQQRATVIRPKVGGFPYLAETLRRAGVTLISALRTDQAGESTFPEFLAASWRAGFVRYDVDFNTRTVAYYGCNEEQYVEAYPMVDAGS